MHDGEQPGLGRQLRQARESAGLSQDAVAEKLRLKSGLVDALEREDFDALPAPAYVRGYIRAYAQLVDCPAEELLARYKAYATDEPELTRPAGLEAYQDNSGAVLRWGSTAVVVVLLGLAGVWLYDYIRSEPMWLNSVTDQGTGTDEPATELDLSDPMNETGSAEHAFPGNQPEWMEAGPPEQAGSSEMGQSGRPAGPAGGAGAAGGPDSQPGGTETVPASGGTGRDAGLRQREQTQPPPDGEAPAGEAEPVWDTQAGPGAPSVPEGADPQTREVLMAPQGGDSLELQFQGASWVEAFDANGYRLVYGMFDRADSGIVVRGKAPFQIVLGDATQVDVTINDSPLELKSHIRPNNTVRLLVEAPDSAAQPE